MSFITQISSKICSGGMRLLATTRHLPGVNSITRNSHVMVESRSFALRIPFITTTLPTINAANGAQVGWNMHQLLTPLSMLVTQMAGFKVKGQLKRRCKDCYKVIREQRAYIICPTHPRHKQMSMKKRDYKTWILTHATQSKVRPY